MKRTALAPLAIASALALSPSAAFAQSSKSEAILGAPSALALLVAQQNGTPIAPAAYRPTSPSSQGVFTNAVASYAKPALASPIANDRPNVFGSVALAVSRTPLDYRWRKVERARVGGAPAAFAAALRNRDALDRARSGQPLRQCAGQLRRRYPPVSARRPLVFGRRHAAPRPRRLRGLCDRQAADAAPRRLRRPRPLSRDRQGPGAPRRPCGAGRSRRGPHAACSTTAPTASLDADTVAGLSPDLDLRRAAGAWTHGYRASQPPVDHAPTADRAAPIVTASLGDQRSRSASLRAFSTGFSR